MKKIDSEACNIAFGQFIQEKRKEKGMLQMDAAAKMGLMQSHLCRIENGTRSVDLAIMLTICRVLDINPMEFFSRYL